MKNLTKFRVSVLFTSIFLSFIPISTAQAGSPGNPNPGFGLNTTNSAIFPIVFISPYPFPIRYIVGGLDCFAGFGKMTAGKTFCP